MGRHSVWLRLAALCAVASVVWPCLAGAPDGAAFASAVDRLEAADVGLTPASAAVPAMAAADGRLRITVESVGTTAPEALLLVNSRPVGRFADGRLSVDVSPGDLLEVDGRAYRRQLVFRVVYADPRLAAPRTGRETATVGDISTLARVEVGV